MRFTTRLSRLEKIAAERRPPCPCQWVHIVTPAQRDTYPRACPRCRRPWHLIVLDEDPFGDAPEVNHAAPRAA